MDSSEKRLVRGRDHDDFGLNQSLSIASLAMFRISDIAWFRQIDIEVMNVIDSKYLERDASEKPVPGFPHCALGGKAGAVKAPARLDRCSGDTAMIRH
jgi:hypothetical protein